MITKKLAIVGIVTMVSVMSFGYARALTISPAIPTTVPSVSVPPIPIPKVDNVNVKEAVSDICDNARKIVGTKSSVLEEKFSEQVNYFKSEKARLQDLVEVLNKGGVDTSKLLADLAIYDQKLARFQDDKMKVAGFLNAVKEGKCSNDLLYAAGALTNAEASNKSLVNDSKDLLQFLNGTIQADVSSLHS